MRDVFNNTILSLVSRNVIIEYSFEIKEVTRIIERKCLFHIYIDII